MDFSNNNQNGWDAFMGYDPSFNAFATGFEMQGAGLVEAE